LGRVIIIIAASNKRSVSLRFFLVLLVLLVAGCQSETAVKAKNSRVVNIESTDDLLALFAEKNYTSKAWRSGIHEVPRLYITNITSGWRDKSGELPVLTKKGIFFRLLAPLALASNEAILADRQRLLKADLNSDDDQQWLLELASTYKIKDLGERVTAKQYEVLKLRVDIIPVSLAMAQSAEESGWGTSRFAVQGNALFGQWDYSGKGIKPKNQREHLGDYTIARFDSPMDSVAAYMLNLNTHRAYAGLRKARAALRAENKTISGFELAKNLDKYSERGADYVDSLHAMMRVNKLSPADEATLVGDEIIYLVPSSS
jgi:uncharacterized FlgJ-related protein